MPRADAFYSLRAAWPRSCNRCNNMGFSDASGGGDGGGVDSDDAIDTHTTPRAESAARGVASRRDAERRRNP